MTTRNLQIVESDISGKADASTMTFGFDGQWYEIDLTDPELKKLQDSLSLYLQHGRKAVGRRKAKRTQVPETTVEQREAIRAWAAAKGIKVADRGRIPKPVMAEYFSEHPNEAPPSSDS